MTDYETIKEAIQDLTKAIEVTYQGETRELLPFVLGPDPATSSGVASVLCYQYGGSNPTLPKGWRCFKVASFTTVAMVNYTPVPGVPKKLKFKEVKKQNCVEDVDVWRH